LFGWLKKSGAPSATDNARAAVTAAVDAAMKLGEILEKNSGPIVMDSRMLPLPKPQMKTALQIAWKVAGNPQLRDAIEVCFLGLSNFQDGVGMKPIDMNISTVDDIATSAKKLETSMPWMKKSMDEMLYLKIELDAFKGGEGAAWLNRSR
jgi:hypothetical protein